MACVRSCSSLFVGAWASSLQVGAGAAGATSAYENHLVPTSALAGADRRGSLGAHPDGVRAEQWARVVLRRESVRRR